MRGSGSGGIEGQTWCAKKMSFASAHSMSWSQQYLHMHAIR